MPEYPLMLIGAILALAVLYVLVPVALFVYRRYEWRNAFRCPETGQMTSVQIDAMRAARTSLFGDPKLEIKDCARWPERRDCDQKCLIESPLSSARAI